MRFEKSGYAIVYEVDTENHEAPLKYSRCMNFNAHYSKFMIKYDAVSKKYFTVANYIFDYEKKWARNLLCLMASDDLETWETVCELLDFRAFDHNKIGFQYVDFSIENEDIIYLSRTAINNAHNFHDSNYSTFHRIKNFRKLLSK